MADATFEYSALNCSKFVTLEISWGRKERKEGKKEHKKERRKREGKERQRSVGKDVYAERCRQSLSSLPFPQVSWTRGSWEQKLPRCTGPTVLLSAVWVSSEHSTEELVPACTGPPGRILRLPLSRRAAEPSGRCSLSCLLLWVWYINRSWP